MRKILIITLIAALAACEKKPAADAAVVSDPAVEEAAAEEAPADPVAAAAETYARLEGSWAETGQCQDYEVRWEIEAQAFQRFEMRCDIERIEPLAVDAGNVASRTGVAELPKGEPWFFAAGVRAIAQCTIEGDNDDVADIFQFVREPDGSLTIVNEANEARTVGLYPCVESEL